MADVSSDLALSKLSKPLNYAEIKKRYMEQVKMYYANRKLPVTTPFTREVVDKIKRLIKERQFLMEAGHPSEHAKYKVVQRYEVIEQNGREILICKRVLRDDPIVQIVPAEDCFDILVDAHLETQHGGKDKMMNTIKRGKYVVPKTSIDFFLVVCEVCNVNARTKRRSDKSIARIFNSRGQVSLVDMTAEPDGQFKHILCYIDRFTSFMLLRPLMTDSVQETAMELLKIFYDFGPPDKLETYNRPFFMQVMSMVNTAHSEFNVSLVLPVKMPVLTPLDIQEILRRWQNKTGSSHWAMGCYMVQWNNNCKVDIYKSSPYSSVFKGSLNGAPKEDLIEKEKSEEQGLNDECTKSSVSDLVNRDDNSHSNSTVVDSDCEEVILVHQENNLSEDDDDCLITITEAPNESVQTLALSTVPLSSKQMSKTPNILRKKPLQEGSYKNRVNVDGKLIVLSPFQNIGNVKNNNYTSNDLKQVEGKDVPKTTNTRCHVCKTEIKAAYICIKCDRNVHLFCSDRLLQPNISPHVLSVTCTSCTLTNRDEEETRKRKHDEIDKDKTNIKN